MGLREGKWKFRDKNGILDSIHTFKNDRYNGINENYLNGVLQISQNYRDGEMHGKFTEFNQEGVIKSKGEYQYNLPNGKWQWFDDNKQVQRAIHYKNGVKDGNFKIYVDGILSLAGTYSQDKRHNEWKWFRDRSYLDSLVSYSYGDLSGAYQTLHTNGKLKTSGFFSNNKFDGEWRWFSEDGKIDSMKTMTSGIANGMSKLYFKNGQLKEQASYNAGKLDGEKSTYYISGQLKDKTVYRLDEKMGPFEIWTSSGQLEERGTYLKNEYHGIIQRNYSTGLLASAATYSRGNLDGITQIFTPSNFLKKESFFDSNKEIARLEYHDNGRFKRVLILDNEVTIYERKWNIDGFEITDQNYIVGTRTKSDYYLSGQLKYECIYKNDLKHGMEWWFNEDRNPTKINLFNNGDKIISHELSYASNN